MLSEVVSDFRTTNELRALFELAARCLAPGGRMVFNVFLAHGGYTPDDAAREVSDSRSTPGIFTRHEMSAAAAGLPLLVLSP